MNNVRRKLLMQVTTLNYKGLKFTSIGNTTVSLSNTNNTPDIKYSIDGGITWKKWNYSAISLSDGKTLCLKGNNPNGFSHPNDGISHYSQFVFGGSGTIEASGNIMSLLDNGACKLLTIPSTNCFLYLFYDCTKLITPPELPAINLTNNCYDNLFRNCTNLIAVPELPADELKPYCYRSLFYGCSKLKIAPQLTATQLAEHCYLWMFGQCTSLKTAPELPANTLADYCYCNMFNGCTSLTAVPELPAMNLAKGCYQSMFYECTSLEYAQEILPATHLPYTKWTQAGNGNSNSNCSGDSRSVNEGVYAHMFRECKNLKSAPILPAKELTPGCYVGMFTSCKKLTRIIVLAESLHVDIQPEWVTEVAEMVRADGGTANKDWMEANSSTCWLDHSGRTPTRRWAVPQSAYNDWTHITIYFTHVYPEEIDVISQAEIDEIVEQYHINYDE